MSKVKAREYNIGDILKGEQYFIEDYQREYRWEEKQITDLLEDLTEKFLNSEEEDHYFLGSIIISKRGDQRFIIDGQQRLTSLTLLLIYIHRALKDQEALESELLDLEEIYELIRSKGDFNLKVDRRSECMSALLNHGEFRKKQHDKSIANIAERYENIKTFFQDNHAGDTSTLSNDLELLKFADWLIKKVYLVRITADSDADAYAIFETMNDRGLRLTPTEMLKGYLLTKSPEELRADLNKKWKELINDLLSIDKGEDADAIKAWLRSQHAQDTRERKSKAAPRDFEQIGTEFHRWVPDNLERLELDEEKDFADFISRDFDFYGGRYKFIRDAAKFEFAKENGVEAIHYNAHNNFTLQRTVLLAPLRKEELNNETIILRKLQIVSSYLDILIARRIWNYKSTAYSTMQYTMFSLIKEIRGESIDGLKEILIDKYLDKMQETFDSQETFGLHSRNTPRVRYLLARMTDYVETQSRGESRFPAYIKPELHEVEHIWADQYEEHGHHENDEFENEHEFRNYRNRIGGLLLLSKSKNRKYGALPYAKKRKHYGEGGENLLVRSLHEGAYQRDPFVEFNDEFKRNSGPKGLEFQPLTKFRKKDLKARQELYRELCKQIWNPKKLRNM